MQPTDEWCFSNQDWWELLRSFSSSNHLLNFMRANGLEQDELAKDRLQFLRKHPSVVSNKTLFFTKN